MVWHFYVLKISILSDASFCESPLQTGVKTDSFTGISSKEVNQQRERAFPEGYKIERDVKPGVWLFHFRGNTIRLRVVPIFPQG